MLNQIFTLILFIILSLCNHSVFAAKSPEEHSNIELTKVSSQIKQLQKKILHDRQEQEDLEQQLKTTEINIGELGQQANHLNQLITYEQEKLNQLKNSHQLTSTQLKQEHLQLAKQIRAVHQLRQIQPLKILLNQENPNTIERNLNYYRHLTQARLSAIFNTKLSLTKLKNNMEEATEHQLNLKKLLSQKQLQQEQQEKAKHHREVLLTKLHQRVQTKEQQLNSLLKNRKALQEVISHLNFQEKNNKAMQNLSQLKGKLRWPVKGSLIANYGNRLDVGDQHLSGVIIKAKLGTPVKALYDGKVIFANWLRGFGLLLIINHGNNYLSLYGRNDLLYAKVGDHVNTGDVIASIGTSGGFEKSSLYFEIRKNGTPVDPNMWCH